MRATGRAHLLLLVAVLLAAAASLAAALEVAVESGHPAALDATAMRTAEVPPTATAAAAATAEPTVESLTAQLRDAERDLGAAHPKVAQLLVSIAELHATDPQRDAEAVQLLERALQLRENAFGPAHRIVAEALSALGAQHHRYGRRKAARDAYERAVGVWESAFTAQRIHTHLGAALYAIGQLYAAEVEAAAAATNTGAEAAAAAATDATAETAATSAVAMAAESSAAFERAYRVWAECAREQRPMTVAAKHHFAQLQRRFHDADAAAGVTAAAAQP